MRQQLKNKNRKLGIWWAKTAMIIAKTLLEKMSAMQLLTPGISVGRTWCRMTT